MDELASGILQKYPIEVLRNAYRRFAWPVRRRAGTQHPTAAEHEAAVSKREEVGARLKGAIRAKCSEQLATALKEVHRWGLAGKTPNALHDKSILPILVAATSRSHLLQEGAVAQLLKLDGIGIATASKWLGLANKTNYAIYDSRVSVALRDLACDRGRYLPVVARRTTKTRKPWPADHIQAEAMAEVYLHYCRALRDIRSAYEDMPPAHTEMGLFVLGDVGCSDPEGWKDSRGKGVWQ